MTPFGWVLVNTAVVIGILVALLMIVDIVLVLSFNAIFNKHQKAIGVLLNVKIDHVRNLYNVLFDAGVEIDGKVIEQFALLQRNDLDEPGSEKFEKCFSNLTFITNSLISICKKNKDAVNSEETDIYIEGIQATEKQFRSIATMYNADCLGYNYWISFYPTRFIWKILFFHPKKLLDL